MPAVSFFTFRIHEFYFLFCEWLLLLFDDVVRLSRQKCIVIVLESQICNADLEVFGVAMVALKLQADIYNVRLAESTTPPGI